MMFPVSLDLGRVAVALAGAGAPLHRRLAALDAAGARRLRVFSPTPDAALAAAAGVRLECRLPDPADLAGVGLLLVAGLDDAAAAQLAATARAAGVLVNVEDRRAWCDFHLPAVMRRGALTLAISTDGRSPGLAARIKRYLEAAFGPEWGARTDEAAAQRGAWRAAGADGATVARLTDALVERRGWLPTRRAP
ncbi:MAG: bifunctional precorrin-2 dehydrogenase/sirohydrochlorin ferrochelatase [Alphaproteobacteria bacterium]